MTTSDSGPVSGPELQRQLASLLRRAEREGVDVSGGWTCRNGDGTTDWDVVVTELRPIDEPE